MPKLVRRENKQEMKVSLTDFRCRIVSIQLSVNGQLMDMVLNYPQVDDYLNDVFYLGATCGPVCNRIGGAAFVLDGVSYPLSKNDGDNCLHSVLNNISIRNWQVNELSKKKVEFRLELVHLEDDSPGDVSSV
jgi:aldose 1-epimerase